MATVGRGVRRGFAQRRKALGFTQESLAARVNVERSTVVRWEAGKSEPLAWLWPKLAVALKVTPEQLTDLLAPDAMLSDAPAAVPLRPADKAIPDDSSSGSNDGNMFHLRRVLMGCIPDTSPGAQLELTAAVTRAWDLFFSARFGEMERALPAALASAYSAAEAETGEPRRQINISVAQLLHASSNLLGYVAQEDLAALALVRADALAAESGDELTRAAIKGSQSWLLAKNGMYDDAAAYADQAATDIEPRLSTATPRHIAIWGELLCYAAFAASRTGDYREARRYLRLCESAGTQLEDEYASRPEASNVFGHTSAASFGVINETGANRPREALKLAAVVGGGGAGIPPTLRSRRLINVAQAQIHNRDDVGAVDTLRHACSMAPEFVGHIPLAHTLTNELLTRRGRQRLDGLVSVAERLGVSVQPVGIRP
ncbi:helix-turn-helix transcriptional regulator [Nocardia sp. NPDC049220]|uniref:helix-turn-helix transcriptional regulator n=1 Tax=Nocardia sp. NPDC049220 TaxID=3155273 RepID=UPI0033D8052A